MTEMNQLLASNTILTDYLKDYLRILDVILQRQGMLSLLYHKERIRSYLDWDVPTSALDTRSKASTLVGIALKLIEARSNIEASFQNMLMHRLNEVSVSRVLDHSDIRPTYDYMTTGLIDNAQISFIAGINDGALPIIALLKLFTELKPIHDNLVSLERITSVLESVYVMKTELKLDELETNET